MSPLLRAGEAAVLAYFLLLNAASLAFCLAAFRAVRRRARGRLYEDVRDVFSNPLTPPVSVVVPACNEAAGVAERVGLLLSLDYPRFEVVVVNDGSTDGTLEALKAAFALTPSAPEEAGALATRRVRAVYRSGSRDNLTVVDKDGGGTADALNAGLNAAQHPYFCALDAGGVLEPDALLRLARELLEDPVRVVGVGGTVRAAGGALSAFEAAESCRAVLAAQAAFSQADGLMSLSGSCAVFERELVVAMGGYRADAAGEDMELVTRLHRHLRERGERGYAVRFVPDPVCRIGAPKGLSDALRRRRLRQRGLLELLSRNSALLFEPRYGAVGTLTLPYLFLFEGWGVLFEGLGCALFLNSLRRGAAGPPAGAAGADFALAFLSLAVAGGAALALAGALLAAAASPGGPRFGRLAASGLFGLLEGLCYRPLTVAMRLLGTLDHLIGSGPAPAPGRAAGPGP